MEGKFRRYCWIIITLIFLIFLSTTLYFYTKKQQEPLLPSIDQKTYRDTVHGPVVGFVKNNTNQWLGIPFAKPPIGELRWRPPEKPETWTQPISANQFAEWCTQPPTNFGKKSKNAKTVGSENCLYLNIYQPRLEKNQSKDKLPVMVWIHGGGNVVGSAAQYHGIHLVNHGKVIMVSINYRLGTLGWFSHPSFRALATKQSETYSGNFGLMDIILALQWVQENITQFDGDPQNVTVFGESAGGSNILALLLSKKAKGLFHKAIIQSGVLLNASLSDVENFTDEKIPGKMSSGKELVNSLLQTNEVTKTREEGKNIQKNWPAKRLTSYLRKQPANKIASLKFEFTLSNFKDGVYLPNTNFWKILNDSNTMPEVSIIIGTNRDEVSLFIAGTEVEGTSKPIQKKFGFIFTPRSPEKYRQSVKYGSMRWRVRNTNAIANRLSNKHSVYGYRFDWDEEPTILFTDLRILFDSTHTLEIPFDEEPALLFSNFRVLFGATHLVEIPFVFGDFKILNVFKRFYSKKNRPQRHELSKVMMGYWTNFSHTGSPNQGPSKSLPPWELWNAEGTDTPQYIILDTELDPYDPPKKATSSQKSNRGIRMSSDLMSPQKLKKEILNNPVLETVKVRCAVFATVYFETPDWNQEIYNDLGCTKYPPQKLKVPNTIPVVE